jgi:hypothetical protein
LKPSPIVSLLLWLWLPLAVIGCGKKGPPRAPLNLVPEPAGSVTARRLGSTVYLQMAVPLKNANGPGPVAVDHLEIYAVTAAPGAILPNNRDLLTAERIIGRIPVKPPVTEDEATPDEEAPKDTRPGPGETVTFVETLTEAQLKPQIFAAPTSAADRKAAASGASKLPPPVAEAPPATSSRPAETSESEETPAQPPPATPVPAPGTASIGGATSEPPVQPPASAPAGATPTPAPAPGAPQSPTARAPAPPITVPTRIYVVRGVTERGRPGTPSGRLAVPLVPAPPAATGLATTFSVNAVTVTWLPPLLESGSPTNLKLTYNVYTAPKSEASSEDMPRPLNDKPLEVASFAHPNAQPGVEQCFIVRTVEIVAGATLESEPSARACITPRDIFPPATPKALSAVAGPGAINLIWDANNEADVVGYVILRAEAPGDTLQPLNRETTRETRYRDTTVTPGVRYVYAIVAVDRAGNRSTPSPRIEETAR